MPRNELTQQQENFCKAYIKYGVGYRAYIEAYPNSKNWKRNSVDVEATKMLNSPKITHRLNELNAEIESALKTSTTLNKRKILEEIVELQQSIKFDKGQTSVNLQALKLLSQIAGLLSENSTTVNVQVNNNQITAEVSDYLNL